MAIRTTIVRHCLKSSFLAVGLKPSSAPEVFDAATYTRPANDACISQIVVGAKTITLYSYSNDPREPSTRAAYNDIEGFLRALLGQRIQWACTAHIGSSKETMKKLRTGKVDEYLAEQRRVETLLENRLNRYLKSFTFRVYRLIS